MIEGVIKGALDKPLRFRPYFAIAMRYIYKMKGIGDRFRPSPDNPGGIT